jgi:hypothetical protein
MYIFDNKLQIDDHNFLFGENGIKIIAVSLAMIFSPGRINHKYINLYQFELANGFNS